MKRYILVSALALALVVPAVAQSATPTRQHTSQYQHLYLQVASKFGRRTPGRNIVRWGLSSGAPASDAAVLRSIAVLQRMLAPPAPVVAAAVPTAISSSYAPVSSGGGYANVPGVPASFAACVAMRESTDGAGSSNIYGILGAGGQGSVAQQKAAFAQMYAARGTEPWAPYDGC